MSTDRESLAPETLVHMPDADRQQAIYESSDLLLGQALELAKLQGAAVAAADIAYEMGRRVYEDDGCDGH